MRVVVAGAGLAGLTAATTIAAAGVDVQVLEPRRRVGGRIMAVEADQPGGAVDLGATWHWSDQPEILGLATGLGLHSFPQHAEGHTLHETDAAGRPVPVEPVQPPAQARRFAGGTNELCLRLAGRLPPVSLELEREVTIVARHDEGISLTVADRDGEETTRPATHVVVAVPPRLVLQNVFFQPALPDDLVGAMRNTHTWMGEAIKCVAVYDSPFWREAGLSGTAFSQAGPLVEVHDACGPGGRPAALWGLVAYDPDHRRTGPAERATAVLAQLARLFGPAAADPVQCVERDWSADAYTCEDEHHHGEPLPYGAPPLTRPYWDGRLVFAGTETAARGGGHMEGAVISGRRAAALILGG
ncbi:MAG: flavin monoamine oxidase family protein [Acidimicrobiales bacterium]